MDVCIVGQSGQWAGINLVITSFAGDGGYWFITPNDIPSGTQFKIEVRGTGGSQFPVPPPPASDYHIVRIADALTSLTGALSGLSNLSSLPPLLSQFIEKAAADGEMWRIRAEEWERQARELKAELEATKGKA